MSLVVMAMAVMFPKRILRVMLDSCSSFSGLVFTCTLYGATKHNYNIHQDLYTIYIQHSPSEQCKSMFFFLWGYSRYLLLLPIVF